MYMEVNNSIRHYRSETEIAEWSHSRITVKQRVAETAKY